MDHLENTTPVALSQPLQVTFVRFYTYNEAFTASFPLPSAVTLTQLSYDGLTIKKRKNLSWVNFFCKTGAADLTPSKGK